MMEGTVFPMRQGLEMKEVVFEITERFQRTPTSVEFGRNAQCVCDCMNVFL